MELRTDLRSSMNEFFSDKILVKNLVIVLTLWLVTNFTYDTIVWQNPSPDDETDYTIDVIASIIELIGFLIGGYFYDHLGIRIVFIYTFIFTTITTFVNIFQDDDGFEMY
jgi:Na+/melibiose symporter-like transporter